MIERLINTVSTAYPLQESLRHLDELVTLDRFQASAGIIKAADLVAEALSTYGLSNVQVHRYAEPSSWWTFEGPASWTPERAELVVSGGGGITVARYPDDPMCLATYSAATKNGWTSAPLRSFHHSREDEPVAGTIVLIDARKSNLQEAIAAAELAGATGIIADPLGGRQLDSSMAEARARIELPAHTKLFGFSVTRAEFAQLEQAAQAGTSVEVIVSVDRSSSMPLVEGCVAGIDSEPEILIQAHLCHPRPGANDNGSGVATALGLASMFASLKQSGRLGSSHRSIRFLFGPEFVGTAAYLHDFVRTGRRPRPLAAFNLDMVGENQALCGGPMTIELPAEHLSSPLGALAGHCLTLLPCDERSYSGALPSRNWSVTVAPFVGASDHAVLADRSVAVPSIMIGHWPDRFNHTSADTLDKVDPAELHRAATIVGACALTLSVADAGMHEELSLITAGHTLGRLLAASKLPLLDSDDEAAFSPASRTNRVGLINFLAECGERQIAAVEEITCRPDTCGRVAIDEQRRLLLALLNLGGQPYSPDTSGPVVERLWHGPFNAMGLLKQSNGVCAERIRERFWADRRGAYAQILALALAIDGRSSRADIIRRAAYGSMLTIDLAFADDVFDSMIAAGWARNGPA